MDLGKISIEDIANAKTDESIKCCYKGCNSAAVNEEVHVIFEGKLEQTFVTYWCKWHIKLNCLRRERNCLQLLSDEINHKLITGVFV